MMNQWVEITFDCLPLRSIGRLDIPIDASPKYRARCERIKAAMEKHGSHNTFYLYNARCKYRLTNRADLGSITFAVEGIVLTDEKDKQAESCDLEVELIEETCDWLTEPVVNWFKESVTHSVAVEFDRYIQAGDLRATEQRIEAIESASDQAGGFLGMYL